MSFDLLSMEFDLIFRWWGVVFLIGIAFLPLTFIVFRKFYDKGYVLSRAIGIVVLSYTLWLLSSLKVISFAGTNVWVFVLLFAMLNAALVYWKWDYFKQINYKELVSPALICEGLFIGAFLFWAYVRGHQPSIEGVEKFMNQGFIMSILRSDYMPAQDMWWAGSGINYYYFGHFISALLIKTAGMVPEIGYNLMVATIFGMMVSFPYSVTSNIMRRHSANSKWIIILSGLIAGAVMAFGSNLHVFFEGVIGNLINGKVPFDGYWYPNATRYIGYEGSFLANFSEVDGAIHEFPTYAAIIADLHAHFTGLIMAFTLAALAVAFVFRALGNLEEYRWYKPTWEMWIYALFLTASYMTNTWDFPIYLLLFGLALWMVNIKKFGCNWKAFYRAVIAGVAIGMAALIFAIPFNMNFQNIALGIGSGWSRMFNEGGGLSMPLISPPDKFFILWGHYLFMTCAFIWMVYKLCVKARQKSFVQVKANKKKKKPERVVSDRKFKVITEHVSVSDAVCLAMLVCAVILIYLPEFVYVKDIYPNHPRANTMFKLTYQAFILFTFVLGYAFFRIWEAIREIGRKRWIAVCMIFVVALPLLYTLPKPIGGGAIAGYYGDIFREKYKGLDGYNFFEIQGKTVNGSAGAQVPVDLSGDLAVVRWLNENVSGHVTVLEANGDSFTLYNRISVATGLPTIVGWATHQYLWRGDWDAVVERQGEVKEIYEGNDITRTRELLNKYDVRYVVLGDFERAQFPNMDESVVRSLGRVVVSEGRTQLIEVEM